MVSAIERKCCLHKLEYLGETACRLLALAISCRREEVVV